MNLPKSDLTNEKIDEIDVELAEKFHYTYEQLAPKFGYETRQDTREFDHESKNGRLMIAVCHEINYLIHQAEITAVKKELKKLLPPHQLEWYQETSGGFCSICGFSAREYKNYINERISALEKEIVNE